MDTFIWFSVFALVSTALGEEITVVGIFSNDPPKLLETLQLRCNQDGDKIKISDMLYRISGCRSSDSRPQDPAAESNRRHIDQCTGKRTCAIPADLLKPPFLPKKGGMCLVSSAYEIVVVYTCVPQDSIKSMCSSFSGQDYMGYLSTPQYPMLLRPGQPVAPCRCSLEATLNSRIVFTILEANLASNSTELDMNTCQTDTSKQYLHIEYNHGMSVTYLLCTHKYNIIIPASTGYEILFENPVSRETGALWMQYSAQDQNAMVKITCHEPIVTTMGPIHYTNLLPEYGGISYRAILAIVAASLFFTIVLAVVILTVKYRRRIRHYLMEKYSKKPRNEKGRLPLPTQTVLPSSKDISDKHDGKFDEVDETTSYGKPTAHIPPQLSINEKINKMTADTDDQKSLGKKTYSPIKSSYLIKKAYESDSDCGGSSSILSDKQRQSMNSSSSKESVVQSPGIQSPPIPRSKSGPMYEDVWLKVNTPERQISRQQQSQDLGSPNEEECLIQRPTVSFSTENTTIVDIPPLMHRSEDSRLLSDEEDMDIKNANVKLVRMSPLNSPKAMPVKPVLKCTSGPKYAAPKQEFVKYSPDSSPSTPSERCSSETDYYASLRKASKKIHSQQAEGCKPNPFPDKWQYVVPVSSISSPTKLMVDVGTPKKSKSLPRSMVDRRQNSVPALDTRFYSKSYANIPRSSTSKHRSLKRDNAEYHYGGAIPQPIIANSRNYRSQRTDNSNTEEEESFLSKNQTKKSYK